MTSSECLTGTDRVFEASQQIDADLFVNVQGDEPLIDPTDVIRVVDAAHERPGVVVNAMCPIATEDDFRSVNVPHVAAAPDGRLLYMSRAAIPTTKDLAFAWGWRQVCIYAFPARRSRPSPPPAPRPRSRRSRTSRSCASSSSASRCTWSRLESVSIAVDVPSDVTRVEAALRAGRA